MFFQIETCLFEKQIKKIVFVKNNKASCIFLKKYYNNICLNCNYNIILNFLGVCMMLKNIKQSVAIMTCVGIVILSFACICLANDKRPDSLSGLLHSTITDTQMQTFVQFEGGCLTPGQVVLMRKTPAAWVFGILQKQLKNDAFDVRSLHEPGTIRSVKINAIRSVRPFWANLLKPMQNLHSFEQLVDDRLSFYKKQGSSSGHGMVIPAGATIVLIGDLHGSYSSLQSHLLELRKKDLLDNNFKLKANCYVVALGNYIGSGPHGVEVLNILLALQKANQDQVYVLAGTHEDQLSNDSNNFQKEFFQKFSGQSDGQDIKRVWKKLTRLSTLLPRFFFAGLQMPSTHHYDFLLFCHNCFDRSWRPGDFMKSIVKNHIDQNYQSNAPLPYVAQQAHKHAFVEGEFANECSSSTTKNHTSSWTKTAFEEFVQRHAHCVDQKYMYTCCLRAMLRGHDCVMGGIARLKGDGPALWKSLKDGKTYEIDDHSVFTCISGSQGLSRSDSIDNAFGLIHAGRNGRWYVTSVVEQA